jgi:hypothetical protein
MSEKLYRWTNEDPRLTPVGHVYGPTQPWDQLMVKDAAGFVWSQFCGRDAFADWEIVILRGHFWERC